MDKVKLNKVEPENKNLVSKESIIQETIQKNEPCSYKLYKYRYLMLFLLSMALFLNGNFWISFSSITPQLVLYFNKSEAYINWYTNLFHVIPIILSFPAIFAQKILGLRWCLIIAGLLHSLGCTLKLIGIAVENLDPTIRYIICFIGFSCYAVAQVFVLNVPSMLSAQWFGMDEREMSTSVPWVTNICGGAFGFLFPFSIITHESFINDPPKGMLIIVSVEFILAGIIFILTLIFAKERPPSPPTRSEEMAINDMKDINNLLVAKNLASQIIGCYKNPKYLLTFMMFSLPYATIALIATFLSEMVEFYIGSDSQLSGYMGATCLLISAVTTFLFGYAISRLGPKSLIRTSIFINFFTSIPITIILALNLSSKNTNTIMFILYSIYGLTDYSFIPLCCEIIANFTYPLDPAVTTNAYLLTGNITAGVVMGVLPFFPKNIKYILSLLLCILSSIFNGLILSFVTFENKRLMVDMQVTTEDFQH